MTERSDVPHGETMPTVDLLRLTKEAGADFDKAHPECLRHFSTLKFVKMLKAYFAASETGTLDMSDAARLKDAESDVLRLHAEKMKFFERTIELERELATAKRQACTAEHRTTCSFAVAPAPKGNVTALVREVRELTETAGDAKNSDDYVGKVFRARVASLNLHAMYIEDSDDQRDDE